MNDAEMLNFIAKNAEMGVVGIDAVIDYADGEDFRQELKSQRTEYQKIYKSARDMLKNRGEAVEHPSPMAKISTDMMSKMKTMTDQSDSKIAEMMVQGNAMGVAKVIKRANEYDGDNKTITDLARKLQATEESNVENMKQYL